LGEVGKSIGNKCLKYVLQTFGVPKGKACKYERNEEESQSRRKGRVTFKTTNLPWKQNLWGEQDPPKKRWEERE